MNSESTSSSLQLAQSHKEEGNKFFKLKKYDRAIEEYSKAIQYDPNGAVYYSNRSACYQHVGEYRAMIRDAQQALRIDPTLAKAYFRLAKGYSELNQHSKAYSVLCRALNIRDDDHQVLNQSSTHSVTNDQQEFLSLPQEEKSILEGELKKCIQKLNEEQLQYEKNQESPLINPFSNLNSNMIASARRIEMEMRKEYYLNHFTPSKEVKVKIIELLDDILRPMKKAMMEFAASQQETNSNENSVTHKIMIGDEEQQKINEQMQKRSLPTSRLNWRFQCKKICELFDGREEELKKEGIHILTVCGISLTYFARPEISYKLAKQLLIKNSTRFNHELNIQERAHTWVMMAQSYLFWKGFQKNNVASAAQPYTSYKPLQYLRNALNLLGQVEKGSNDSNVKHMLAWTYISLITQMCPHGDELSISKTDLESLLNDMYQLLFILDSSEHSEASHTNTVIQEGLRFWFSYLQHVPEASDQFQRLVLLSDSEVTALSVKLFNEFHSANLPLPKVCLDKFFLYAPSEGLTLRSSIETFIRSVRLGLISLTENMYSDLLSGNSSGERVSQPMTRGFLQRDLYPLFYAFALQSFHSRYCCKMSEKEQELLQRCEQRFKSLVKSLSTITTKANLCDSSMAELHNLLVLISMYRPIYEIECEGTDLQHVIQVSHRDYPYLLSKLLYHTLKIPKKMEKITSHSTEIFSKDTSKRQLLNEFYESQTIPFDHDFYIPSSNLITSTLKIHKEIEWNYPEYWPKGFDDSEQSFEFLLIGSGFTETDITKVLHRSQPCVLTCVELGSDSNYLFCKEVFKNEIGKRLHMIRLNHINDLTQVLSNNNPETQRKPFDYISINMEALGSQKSSLTSLLSSSKLIREGSIVRFSLPSIYQVKMVKNIRDFLYQHLRQVFERDDYDGIPTLKRAPSRSDLLLARELLRKEKPFSDFICKISEFYNLNAFCDLIFSPLIEEFSVRVSVAENVDSNKGDSFGSGFTFESMSQLLEKELGLRVIGLVTSSMPFHSITGEYLEETKDFKLKNWKLMDAFAAKRIEFFQAPIQVLCEIPVKKVEVDKKKDPLGLKKYLRKYTSK
ncbi:hypothetical protein FDP41_011213 [Naegleria fowleri]|uniref:Uncharacterized protein n=1 Tax=Naegleria fowleri TaxID=5763 RepID=A0A6A5BW32_NAEFO|nr:uncharacterized protein FDP41_011213 [Naegleria fowleri]KAF0982283.1 hypothetical protein FDP41_011213 [Naegleria fowleri]CAG4716065.1 unnamed protein product [Naegleria fowleri]